MRNILGMLRIRFISIYLALRNLFVASEQYKGIKVRGVKEFRNKIISSLEILDERLPKEFEFIENNIIFITEHVFTCSNPSKIIPAACIGYKRWPNESIEELARSIAHESYHCFLFNDYLKKHPASKDVPKHVYLGEKAERQCTTYAYFEVGKWLGLNDRLEENFARVMKSRWWETPYWERVDW